MGKAITSLEEPGVAYAHQVHLVELSVSGAVVEPCPPA